MKLSSYLKQKKMQVDCWLDELLPAPETKPETIHKAMRYSVMAGGKRIRPILAILSAEMFGAEGEDVKLPACSLELIHTYSLVHDDLPSMDNDDFRRGKPTCHKVFGEAIGILAGDALLTEAFNLLHRCPTPILPSLVREISAAAGSCGMVGGQVLDMLSTGQEIEIEELKTMHRLKTGALISTPLVIGALAAGLSDKDIELVRLFGGHLGLLFQITDDLLDATGDEDELGKPVGRDEEKGKATFVSVLGLTGSRKMAESVLSEALSALAHLPAADEDKRSVMELLAEYLYKRRI
ncbi:MAG: polyprenyl synthetase family protein [Candidatus Wallbacteria bacterium]|nr:polyprenyl synthetase family protein [Candidatus Wallbacteria bacterium]